jgi:hypothetical protein
MRIEDLADESDPVAAPTAEGVVSRPQIGAVLRYRAAGRSLCGSSCTAARRPPSRGEALLDEMYPRGLANVVVAARVTRARTRRAWRRPARRFRFAMRERA